MKIIINDKLIKRNKAIGKYATIGSVISLVIGLYMTFQPGFGTDTNTFTWTFALILVGFILSQIGSMNQIRWGRSPRADEALTASLKGLDDRNTLYHYTSPVSHLLIGPAGIWAFLPYNQPGKIAYTEKGWKQTGGSWFAKTFAGDSLGKPENDIQVTLQQLTHGFQKALPDVQLPDFQVALVFTNPNAEFDLSSAPSNAFPVKKLKDQIRKNYKSVDMDPVLLDRINAALQSK